MAHRIHLTIPDDLMAQLDVLLDGRPRAPWIQRAIEEKLAGGRCPICGGTAHDPQLIDGVEVRACPAVPPGSVIDYEPTGVVGHPQAVRALAAAKIAGLGKGYTEPRPKGKS
jgi:hypothetical protein